MTTIETNMAFVRAIATWQPITKLAGTGILENVAFHRENDNTLAVFATDRFRLAYAYVHPSQLGEWEGKKLAPMKLFTDLVTLHKVIRDHEKVVFEFADNGVVMVTVLGNTVQYHVTPNNYPALENLLNDWQPVGEWPNNFKLNMKLVADLAKFANPNVGVLTAAKRDNAWQMALGESKAIRFHQGEPEKFGVLIMSMKY